MHRRLPKSLAALVGAAALLVAPVALIAPAQAAVVAVDPEPLEPDEVWEFDEDFNHVEFWEDFLAEEEDVDAICVKFEPIDKPYQIPEIDEAFPDLEGNYAYILAVLKGGADENANELYWEPEAGDWLSHHNAGNSHVILCVAELEDETSTPTPSKTPTGPVVETDRLADSGSSNALGLLAGGALVAGAAALILNRRRQGAHR